MPGVSALTVSLALCITVSLRQPRGPGARPRGWSWLCALHSPGGRLAGRVRAGGAARVGGRGRAPCSAGDCAFRPGSPRLPGCAEGGGGGGGDGDDSSSRAAFRPLGAAGVAAATWRRKGCAAASGQVRGRGPRPEGLWGRRERGASRAWPDRMRTCVSVQPAGSS